MQNMSDEQIQKAIETFNKKLPLIPEGEDRDLCLIGLENFQNELARRSQKKSDEPIGKTGQLQRTPIRNAAEKVPQETKDEVEAWVESLPVEPMTDEEWEAYQEWKKKPEEEKQKEHKAFVAEMDAKHLKTIKAPVIDREPEYINIELTDQKGAKYIRTYNRAQTKALCRKYFSNVHSAWAGGNRKLTNGFDNLLAFFLGWVEFDGKTPRMQDVLQDYFRYKKASEKTDDSEAFKVAKELYDKIILVTSRPE